jgi:TctA family transporter
MLGAAWEGLTALFHLDTFALMFLGVVLGSIFAALPGIGGIALLTMMLPFAMSLNPTQCIALLIATGIISNTANTFPSVLMAVPGSAGAQATIVDGYPMAEKGEAARAFGAAFTVSALGGLFGAVVLTASLPVFKPLVLSFGTPEFFILCLWGVSMVGVLSGKAPLRGIIAGGLGILLSMVGFDTKSGVPRYVFGMPYLWEGIAIIIMGLGIFALPEAIAMFKRATSISQVEYGSGLLEGIKDGIRHWWLVIRCAIIGVWVGFIPGMGSSVADWFAYAHAVQTEKNRENFGKGDVRGVIAPESSNNAKEGGALIPTLAFGIPGSTSFAIILIAFLAVGIQPGPRMLTDQLPFVFEMVWILVIANMIATGLCLALGRPMARIAFMPYYVVAPMVIVLCFMAAFAAHFSWNDLLMMLAITVLGYFMKRFDWPRPPLLIGVVLGDKMEKYLWLSTARYGASWLLKPSVIILLLLLILTVVVMPFWRARQREKRKALERMVP